MKVANVGDTSVGQAAGPAETRKKPSRPSGLPSWSENLTVQHDHYEALAAVSGAALDAASSVILAVKSAAGSALAPQARLIHT